MSGARGAAGHVRVVHAAGAPGWARPGVELSPSAADTLDQTGSARGGQMDRIITYDMALPSLLAFWPLWVLLGVLAVVSHLYDRRFRATMRDYAALRRASGAGDDEWPDRRTELTLVVSPALTLTLAVLVGLVSLLGTLDEVFRTDPLGRLPGYVPLPASVPSIVASLAGWLVTAGLVVATILLVRSPWAPIARRIRRASVAPDAVRERAFAEALASDPGLRGDQEPGAVAR